MAAVAGGLHQRESLLSSSPTAKSASTVPALVATATPGSTTTRAALLTDDAYEQNDSMGTARNLGTLSGPATLTGLVMADSNDWYRFTTTTKPGASDTVSIQLQNSQGDLDLAIYNVYGQRVRYAGTTANNEQVSLSGLPAGTYYIRVYGYQGATNPNYSLNVDLARPLVDDSYEQNDSLGTATNLGTLTAAHTVSNLVMADSADWFRFSTSSTGTSSDFVGINFQHAKGNLTLELYNSSGSRLASSASYGDSERISLSGRAAGTYFVRVTGVNGVTNPNYSLQVDPPSPEPTTPAPTAPTSSGAFDIQFTFAGLSATQQAIFDQAAAKWESVIVGDLPNITHNGTVIDDLLIHAIGTAIDGEGSILGQAGPDYVRSSTYLPYLGTMEFDTADLASMEADGTLLGVIEHEMAHVLGIGTIWAAKGLIVGAGTSNPLFVGANAVAAYNAIFGTSASGVPVENTGGAGTRDGHWRETIFGTEIMTGWVGPGTDLPISRITVGSLADLGYTVNYAAADPFSPSLAVLASLGTTTTSTTTSTTATVSSPAAVKANVAQSARDSLLASWDRLPSNRQSDDDLPRLKQHSDAAATDALLTEWSDLSLALLG